MERQMYRTKKIVPMSPKVRRAVSWSRFWYKPIILALLSPVSVVLVLRSFKLTLPWFLTHPVSLVYLTAISTAFIWIRHRKILASVFLLLLFMFSGSKRRTEINDYFEGGKVNVK